MTMPDLLPCPFCSNKAYEANSTVEGQCIICSGCQARTIDCGNFVIAREKWNTRAPIAQGGALESLNKLTNRHGGLSYTELGEWVRDNISIIRAALQAGVAMNAINYNLGRWLSAALDDPNVCQEMKDDINAWFSLQPKDSTDE